MLTKYAALEGAQILDLKGFKERVKTASLDKLSDFEDWRTEDGYLYARIRAISSRVNRNYDGWPSVELAGGTDAFNKASNIKTGHVVIAADTNAKYGYSTFLYKPIFVDHHNSDPDRARGIIVDSKLHIEDHKTAAEHDSYYASAPENHNPPTWVELLLEVDAKSFPKLAAAIIKGSEDPNEGIDGFSMGCDVEYSKCSHCGNKAQTPDQYCEHVKLKGAEFPYTDKHGKTSSRKAYEDCYGIKFFEISAVFDPADETALLREIRAHTAAGNPYEDDPALREKLQMEMDKGVRQNHFPEDLDNGQISSQNGETPCPTCGNSGRLDAPGTQLGWEPCPNCEEGGRLAYEYPPQGMNVPGRTPQGEGYNTPHQLGPEDMTLEPANRAYDGPRYQGSVHTAEAPPPQVDELKVPEGVNTLREESICPVCGSDMDSETCSVCGFEKEPEGFDNPDLTKAERPNEEPFGMNEVSPQPPEAAQTGPEPGATEPDGTSNTPTTAHVTSDMSWSVTTTHEAHTNPDKERPVVPNAGPASDEPKKAVVKTDHTQPVTSHVRTAEDFLAASAQRRTMSQHTADAASGAPEAATPDKNIDVDAVGGIMDASNEEASRADAQIDVDGQGYTGPHDVSADKTESVDQGSETSKNVEEIPTKTWSGTDGNGVEKQTDPVGGGVYPAEGGVTSSWSVTALDSSPFPEEDGGLAGGTTVKGVEPADPVGKADDRVDVLDATTSPANNSGDTKTWSGTDGNGVTRQQEPVTNETLEKEDIVNLDNHSSSTHIFAALKLADHEVELGLTAPADKFNRAEELEKLTPEELQAENRVVARVKTAGLSKETKVAMRMPAMGRSASVEKESKEESNSTFVADSSLFLR
jgi:hypothetical protein